MADGIEVFPRHIAIGEETVGQGPPRALAVGLFTGLQAGSSNDLDGLRGSSPKRNCGGLLAPFRRKKFQPNTGRLESMTRMELLPPEKELAANQKPELKLRHFPIVLAYVICIAAVLCAAVLLDVLISIAAVTLIAGLVAVLVPVLLLAVLCQQHKKRTR